MTAQLKISSEGETILTAEETSFEDFLVSVERPAYRMALLSVKNRDDAFDVVQNAFFKFTRNYRSKPEKERKPLFYRVLQTTIIDWHRKAKIKRVFTGKRLKAEDGRLLIGKDELSADFDVEGKERSPLDIVQSSQEVGRILETVEKLPFRQKQVFLLRAWQDLSIADTAKIIGCSEGAVKAHYSRATKKLQELLGDVENEEN